MPISFLKGLLCCDSNTYILSAGAMLIFSVSFLVRVLELVAFFGRDGCLPN